MTGATYHEARTPWWTLLLAVAAVWTTWMAIALTVDLVNSAQTARAEGQLIEPNEQQPADKRQGQIIGASICGVVGLTMLVLTIGFGRYSVEADRNGMEFGFFWFRKRLRPEELENVEATEARFGEFLGLGIRLGLKRRLGYLAAFGPAVEVRTAAGKTLVFTCRSPAECIAALGRA